MWVGRVRVRLVTLILPRRRVPTEFEENRKKTHPRACTQLLDHGVDRGLAYAYAAKSLEYLTFPEDCSVG
jgi:hypothetical protein